MGKELADEMDYCLGCLACATACPAAVDYTTMFETARAEGEAFQTSRRRRLLRWLTLDQLFLFPRRLKWLGTALRLYQNSVGSLIRRLRIPYLLGNRIGELEKQTPVMEREFSDSMIAELESPPAGVKVRGRVGMLSGCVQSLAFSSVNRATVDVLLHNGWEVFTPRLQSCCGSIHAHNGAPELAEKAARALMKQFELDSIEAIISNAGGCGGHLKRYQQVLPDDADAAIWDSKVRDIHEFLVEQGFESPAPFSAGKLERVTYHESCHLRHGQGIADAPREILKAIPNLELVELAGSAECCGSAGIYNLLQPEESERQLEKKLNNIQASCASTVATSNPGCHLQIAGGLSRKGGATEVTQPIVLLAAAYRGALDSSD